MSSTPVSRRLAVPTFLLARAPAFGAHLAGIVQDAAGRPVAGAVVVASSETDVRVANGASRKPASRN